MPYVLRLARKWWNSVRTRASLIRRELTRDFNYSTDFFIGLDFLMAIAGMRFDSANGKLRRLWRTYRLLLWILPVLHFRNIYLNVKFGAPFDVTFSTIQTVGGYLSGFFQLFLFGYYSESIRAVRLYVNRQSFGRNLQPSLGIRSNAFYNTRKMVIGGMSLLGMVVISTHNVDMFDYHPFKPPFNVRQKYPIVQWFCEMTINCMTDGLVATSLISFLVTYMILKGMAAQVQVISETFAVCFDSTDRRVENKVGSKAGSVLQMEFMTKYYHFKYLQEELNKCTELHVEFLSMLSRVRPLLNAKFLQIYCSTALNMASGAMYLASSKSITLYGLLTLLYSLVVSIECLLLTRQVSLLTEAHESIGSNVYDLHWPDRLRWDERFASEYRSIRKTILTVQTVAQQMPLRLNGYGGMEFTQDRFWEVLLLAYNFYNVFKDYNECCVAPNRT